MPDRPFFLYFAPAATHALRPGVSAPIPICCSTASVSEAASGAAHSRL